VRLRYRDPERGLYERLRVNNRRQEGARGELRVSQGSVRWGAYPDGLSYCEGRVAAMLDGDDAHYLASAAQLVDAADVFADTLGAPREQVLVGRLDLASELRFADGAEGRAFLVGAAAIDVPWLKTGTEGGKRSGLETVYWRTTNGRSVVLRLYDKGVESGTADAGKWLRGERQRRFRKGRELQAVAALELELRSMYVGRELAKLAVSDVEVTVCDTPAAIELLGRLASTGDISAMTRDALTGFLVWGGLRSDYARPTWYRRWAALRELGIAVDESAPAPARIPVAGYVGRLVDAWAVAA
jgi:hypothetical protein